MIAVLRWVLWAAHWLITAAVVAALQLLATLSLNETTAPPTAVTVSVLTIWSGYLTAPQPRAGRR